MMIKQNLSPAAIRWLVLAGIAAVMGLVAVSCQTVRRQAVILPEVPGAKYIGSGECELCHDEIYRDFATSDHARLITAGPNALPAGCESCHGPGSVHSETGGETLPPYSFTAGRPAAVSYDARPGLPPARATERVCYECHNNVRGEFNLPHHHPVAEGRMSCTACHPPHKSPGGKRGLSALQSMDASCLTCHPAQRGPHVFEHEAMREGCTTCHAPHGSVNAKLLTARDSNLCLKCHFQQVQGGVLRIGGSDHTLRVQQGGCWTAGCHEAVHGSQVNSSLRF